MLGDVGRELSEEQRPIVGRHVVQHRGDIRLTHRPDQRLLGGSRQVLEDFGGDPPRQDSERDDLLVGRKVEKRLGDFCRPEPLEVRAKLFEGPGTD